MYWSCFWGSSMESWDPRRILPFHGSSWSQGSMGLPYIPIVSLWDPWIISSPCSFEHAPLASLLGSPFSIPFWGILSPIFILPIISECHTNVIHLCPTSWSLSTPVFVPCWAYPRPCAMRQHHLKVVTVRPAHGSNLSRWGALYTILIIPYSVQWHP